MWSRTGQAVGAGEGAPAGVAPGPGVVGATVQEPLVAGGGGGKPGVGAPPSGAGRTKKVAQSPHPIKQTLAQKLLRGHLIQWLRGVGGILSSKES